MHWISELVQQYPTAVIGAIGTLGSSLTVLARWIWDRWREGRTFSLAEQAELRATAQDILQRIPDISPALRALLVHVSNGGGSLKGDGPLYVTIEMEARQPDIRSMRREWQKREAPDSYRAEILAPLIQGAQTHVVSTDDLGPGVLRDQYLMDGVKSASIVVLYRVPDGSALWLLKVHTPVLAAEILVGEDTETTLVTRSAIASAAARITPIVRKLK